MNSVNWRIILIEQCCLSDGKYPSRQLLFYCPGLQEERRNSNRRLYIPPMCQTQQIRDWTKHQLYPAWWRIRTYEVRTPSVLACYPPSRPQMSCFLLPLLTHLYTIFYLIIRDNNGLYYIYLQVPYHEGHQLPIPDYSAGEGDREDKDGDKGCPEKHLSARVARPEDRGLNKF